MLKSLGATLTNSFKEYMPDAFVFALGLTFITAIAALIFADTSFIQLIEAWYKGFWLLLEFGMQMTLILITGYSIALSPFTNQLIKKLTGLIRRPAQVYPFVIIVGALLASVSWGWVIITGVLAREMAKHIKGIHYPYLIACVYYSSVIWVSGLSSSIPLLLNTENNYLIESGILSNTIPTAFTLGSHLNIFFVLIFLFLAPLLFFLRAPKSGPGLEDLLIDPQTENGHSIKNEASSMNNEVPSPSDKMNNSPILQYLVALVGLIYVVYYFSTKGLALDLNIMIFIFIMLGLILHKTPMRYGIAMKRSSMNISAILFQFPFYAGIMGIMIYTGLGQVFSEWMASAATTTTYPLFAYLSGAVVNFAIPSAGGEFAVIGPSTINAVKELALNLPEQEATKMIARASMAVAYGETMTNALQPFYLLIILPVMGIGTRIQARDVMGYLLIPFLVFFSVFGLLVMFAPL